uniref:Uncharacterized protein n=1 Tax=Arundo donax TaxID=35708 RepID=A0A0A8Z7I5_ARUDO
MNEDSKQKLQSVVKNQWDPSSAITQFLAIE